MAIQNLPPFLQKEQEQQNKVIPPFLKKKEEEKDLTPLSNGANTPISESQSPSFESVLNPTANLFGTITTPNGVSFNIDKSKLPAPSNTPDYITEAQKRINDGVILPADEQSISLATGKKQEAVSAYLNGDNKTGQAIDRVDFIDKNKQNLTNILSTTNPGVDPNTLLQDPDKLSAFIQDYQKKLQENITKATPLINSNELGVDIDPSNFDEKNKLESVANNFLQIQKPILDKHITETTVDLGLKNGEAPEVTLQKIAQRIDPIGYKNAQKALNTKTGLDSVSDQSGFGEIIGSLKDEISGTTGKEEILNTTIGQADLQRNQALQKLAMDKAAEAHLTGDIGLLTEAKNLYEQYKPDLIKKYPALQMQQMAAEISNDVARDAGNLQGSDAPDGLHNLGATFFGETNAGYIQRMKDKGWFDNPDTKDLANRLAAQPELFSDASYLGNAAKSFIQPFKDLGLSIADISEIRNKKDVISDKMKDELFPKETANLINPGVRTVLNTSANLAGMVAIGAVTGGIGRAAGIGLDAAETAELASEGLTNVRRAELVSKIGSTNSTIDTLSNAASFGLPSVDSNLKDSYNFIDNDASRAIYAGTGAILNTVGGKLLDLPKISAVPGLASDFAKFANGITDKSITEDAAAELLNEGKNKYVDFAVKYGKNVTEGAATMAYFTATNKILKSSFGDPNTTGEDIIKNTGSAFMDGLLGMMVFGAIKTKGEFDVNKNSTFKNGLYNMALTPDATEDVFNLGKKSDEDFAQKMKILNTAVVAKNSLNAAMSERSIDLDTNQQAVYISNKTVEAYIRNHAESLPEGEQKSQLLEKADRLKTQSTQTLDGLKFTETLEPLYDIFHAEQQYNKAVDDANAGNGNLELLATAKTKIDEAVQRHQDIRANPKNETDVNGDIIAPKAEIVPLADNEAAAGLNRAAPQLSEEQVKTLQPTIDKMNAGENVNEKELGNAQNVLYDALDKNEGASHLIEPLIQKLQDYGRSTTTETSTVTEKVPIEGTFGNRSQQEIKPALEHATGSEATVTLPDGGVRTGTLNEKGGQYVLDIPNAPQIIIGEKAITDRDISLPDKEKVPIPVTFNENGDVESITLQLNKVDKENGGTVPDRIITIKPKDQEKALDLAIQLQSESVGKIPDEAFDKAYETVSKDVVSEIPKENISDKATKLVEPLLGKGALIGIDKPEDALKLIAEQAQNVGSNGEDLSGTADARQSTENTFGKEVVDAAVQIHPRETLLSKELPTPKLEDVVSKSEIKFREPEQVSKILSQELPDRTKEVQHTDIIDGVTKVSRAKDVQRQEKKNITLLDLLMDCLTK